MSLKVEIDPATAAELSEQYKRITVEHRSLLSSQYAVGILLTQIHNRLGEARFRIWTEALKLNREDVDDLLTIAADPDVVPKVAWNQAGVVSEAFATADTSALNDLLANKFKDFCEQMLHVGIQRIQVGRLMADLREQMGEQTFKQALAKACQEIPYEHAEEFMNAGLDSEFTRRYLDS